MELDNVVGFFRDHLTNRLTVVGVPTDNGSSIYDVEGGKEDVIVTEIIEYLLDSGLLESVVKTIINKKIVNKEGDIDGI